jgi:GxxExxY protein
MDERDPKTFAIIGAAMEVHGILGPGLLEAVYEEAMGLELTDRDVAFELQVPLEIRYKHHRLTQTYRADLVCYGDVLVELKAVKKLTDIERAQIINYLKITGMKTGLLLNFGAPSLEYERFKN